MGVEKDRFIEYTQSQRPSSADVKNLDKMAELKAGLMRTDAELRESYNDAANLENANEELWERVEKLEKENALLLSENDDLYEAYNGMEAALTRAVKKLYDLGAF